MPGLLSVACPQHGKSFEIKALPRLLPYQALPKRNTMLLLSFLIIPTRVT